MGSNEEIVSNAAVSTATGRVGVARPLAGRVQKLFLLMMGSSRYAYMSSKLSMKQYLSVLKDCRHLFVICHATSSNEERALV